MLENLSYCWSLTSSLRLSAGGDEGLLGSLLAMRWCWAMDKTRVRVNV